MTGRRPFVATALVVCLWVGCKPNPADPTAPVVIDPEPEPSVVVEPEPEPTPEPTPAEMAYLEARAAHYEWHAMDISEDHGVLQEQYTEFRGGISELVELYQLVFAHDEPQWTPCALYMQGRVYQDAARTLFELQSTDLYKLLEMYSREHAQTVELMMEGYLDSALAQWEYAQNNVDLVGGVDACSEQIRSDAACGSERETSDLGDRVACVPPVDLFLFGANER